MSDQCMRHEPHSRRFVNHLEHGRVLLTLQSTCEEIREGAVVLRDGTRSTLTALGHINGHEYYHATVPAVHPIEYAFCVHACGMDRWVRPDGPESWYRFDPAKQAAFETPAWVRDAVFYQIFPDRFFNGDKKNDPKGCEPWGTKPALRNFMGGDLAGIIAKLDYLADDLGVNALYLTPIFESASNHKYDTIDYFKVDPAFGDTKLLRKLVKECHRRGMRIILDAVLNHCSNLHPYFADVRKRGKKSRYWDWFHIKQWPIPAKFTKPQEALGWYDCWWGFYTLPKLNYANPEVEAYFLKVGEHWIHEADIDGWRLDVPNEVIDSFWPKFRNVVKTAKSDAYIVGEIWDDATRWLQGDQFDAVMNYRFQKALLGFIAEHRLSPKDFDHTLRQITLDYPEQATAVMLNLLGSHDTPRPMTAAGKDVTSLQLMAALQFTFEGAPCIYYGDEVGVEGEKDPDCRRCYPWHDESLQDRQLLDYYRRLIAARKANPALRHGSFRSLIVDNDRDLYVFERKLPDNRCIVALNRGKESQVVQFGETLSGIEELSGAKLHASSAKLPARQAAIWRVI